MGMRVVRLTVTALGVLFATAAATMAVPSTVPTYISVTEEKPEKLPATMFPTMQRLRSAKESRLGLNSRIVCQNSPP